MYNRLISFLEKEDILYNKQFGFRAQHTTDHAILSIIDKIQTAIDDHDYSCGIFLDFSKAFDTVNHNILIKKLEKLGIRGIAKDWFYSLLCDRQQFVSLNSTSSDLCTESCGRVSPWPNVISAVCKWFWKLFWAIWQIMQSLIFNFKEWNYGIL